MTEENVRDRLHNLAEAKDDRPHAYSTPQSPNFAVQLSGGTVTSHKGVLRLTDAENDELEKLIKAGRPDLTQNLVPLKMAEAEAMARADIARKAAAHRGGTSTASSTEGATKNAELRTIAVNIPEGTPPELAQKMQGNGEQIKIAAEADAISTKDLAAATDGEAGRPMTIQERLAQASKNKS